MIKSQLFPLIHFIQRNFVWEILIFHFKSEVYKF